MKIGVPTEIKSGEGRVALIPAQVRTLAGAGHELFVQAGAGRLSDIGDDAYRDAGAAVLESAVDVYSAASLIAKVKEFLPAEYPLIRPDHILFTNLHTALNRELTDMLLERGATSFAAEETHQNGSPNSALAGEVGAFEAVRLCFAPHGGAGRHFIAHYGADPIDAVVIGLGNVGRGAVRTLLRLGCRVSGLDISPGARYRADIEFGGTGFTTGPLEDLEGLLPKADVILNCVLWDKQRKDHLICRTDLRRMRQTALIADISCDTAGAVETTRPTTWADPVYVEEGIRHFCVDNIPGAVAVTASAGYSGAIAPHILKIADAGPADAVRDDPWIARGLTTHRGTLYHRETGLYQDRPFSDPSGMPPDA